MRFILIVGQLWLLQTWANADVQLPKIFTDHMVIQQDLPINVWGQAGIGEEVTVSLNGNSVTTKAGEDGTWRLALPEMKADGKTHTLIVQGRNSIKLKDILIGEVWLCSGQSNMGRPVGSAAMKKANYPNIRLFHVDGKTPRKGDLDDTVGWLVCSPEALRISGDGSKIKRRPFSEVAYEFGRKLHEELKVPVGVIQSNTGGSTAKDWTPLPDAETKFPFDQEIARLKHTSGACYRVKLRGLIPLTIRGAIWYQGEDDGRNRKYKDDLTRMIEAWRANWGRKDLPFYMAQIAQTTYASGMLGVTESHVQVMHSVPHTGLASSNNLQDKRKRPDKGNPRRKIEGTGWPIVSGSNPHPPNKHIVAGRLADIALAKLYGKLNREVFGPMLDTYEIENARAIIKFKYVGAGLKTDDGLPPNWFEISDGTKADARSIAPLVYLKAKAKRVGKDTIEVWSPKIRNPKFVRFAWHALARHNLVNGEGIPAIPFRSDKLPQMWNRR